MNLKGHDHTSEALIIEESRLGVCGTKLSRWSSHLLIEGVALVCN